MNMSKQNIAIIGNVHSIDPRGDRFTRLCNAITARSFKQKPNLQKSWRIYCTICHCALIKFAANGWFMQSGHMNETLKNEVVYINTIKMEKQQNKLRPLIIA